MSGENKTGKPGRLIAHIDCIEPIPCNPCETSCPFHAVHIGEDITALPRLDRDSCRGCGICLAVCPGLAIRLIEDPVDNTEQCTVAFPYEYPDIPEAGAKVGVVDRNGTVIGKGSIEKLQQPLKDDPTRVVYVKVEAGIAGRVQSLERRYE